MKNESNDTEVKNVYLNGELTVTAYTQKWIELINKIEKDKTATAYSR